MGHQLQQTSFICPRQCKHGPHLGEIPYHVTTTGVALRHDVEQEWLHVEIQCLVVEEQLGQQTEVLSVLLVALPVHFKHRDLVLPIDLSTRWVWSQASELKWKD